MDTKRKQQLFKLLDIIFSRKTFCYISGTCICIILVLMTLGIMELVTSSTYRGSRSFSRSDIEFFSKKESIEKIKEEEPVTTHDTILGPNPDFPV